MPTPPILPTDDDARAMARALLANARHAALAVTGADGKPHVSRIAFALAPDGTPITLISSLASHTAALKSNPTCALLIGEPPAKGDPLAFPRLSLNATAQFIPRESSDHLTLRAHYLTQHPKAQLYVDFSDFSFVHLAPVSAELNSGFGKAYRLAPPDFAITHP